MNPTGECPCLAEGLGWLASNFSLHLPFDMWVSITSWSCRFCLIPFGSDVIEDLDKGFPAIFHIREEPLLFFPQLTNFRPFGTCRFEPFIDKCLVTFSSGIVFGKFAPRNHF